MRIRHISDGAPPHASVRTWPSCCSPTPRAPRTSSRGGTRSRLHGWPPRWRERAPPVAIWSSARRARRRPPSSRACIRPSTSRRSSRLPPRALARPDTWAGPGSMRAARLAAGAGCEAVADVLEGRAPRRSAPCGLPGTTRARCGHGLLLTNAVAVVARAALAQGLERVCILDWDVHHGNGTQEVFADDPAVLMISLHQSGLWPGTGAEGRARIGPGWGRRSTSRSPAAPGPRRTSRASGPRRCLRSSGTARSSCSCPAGSMPTATIRSPDSRSRTRRTDRWRVPHARPAPASARRGPSCCSRGLRPRGGRARRARGGRGPRWRAGYPVRRSTMPRSMPAAAS